MHFTPWNEANSDIGTLFTRLNGVLIAHISLQFCCCCCCCCVLFIISVILYVYRLFIAGFDYTGTSSIHLHWHCALLLVSIISLSPVFIFVYYSTCTVKPTKWRQWFKCNWLINWRYDSNQLPAAFSKYFCAYMECSTLTTYTGSLSERAYNLECNVYMSMSIEQ